MGEEEVGWGCDQDSRQGWELRVLLLFTLLSPRVPLHMLVLPGGFNKRPFDSFPIHKMVFHLLRSKAPCPIRQAAIRDMLSTLCETVKRC